MIGMGTIGIGIVIGIGIGRTRARVLPFFLKGTCHCTASRTASRLVLKIGAFGVGECFKKVKFGSSWT